MNKVMNDIGLQKVLVSVDAHSSHKHFLVPYHMPLTQSHTVNTTVKKPAKVSLLPSPPSGHWRKSHLRSSPY